MPGFSRGWGFKRLFDIIFSAVLLLLVLPLFVITALLIRLDSHGPIFFNQTRFGRGGKLFKVFKFRTMRDLPRKTLTEIRPDNPDVTGVGKYLRRFKIDELPQLLNVLRGDMSIVGPRPGLAEQLDELDEIGKRRLLVRPGLTGLAQVHGNIYLSWPERWRYDAEYVEKQSFRLDCWILWRTIAVIIWGEKPGNTSTPKGPNDGENID